jgi:ADP-ribose pyrophosphatase YjhB (NUDIX family)
MTEPNKRAAAVSLVENDQGDLLLVWNRRYSGWTLPGGLVEDGEVPIDAQARELREETSLETSSSSLVYSAPTERVIGDHRANVVYVFRVAATGEAREMEHGCPIMWASRETVLRICPFRDFYRRMFDVLER